MTGPIRETFAQHFDRAAEVIWAAPGRVNVIGEHTDYNDGFALPIALPVTTTAAVAARSDRSLRLVSLQRPDESVELTELRPGAGDGWSLYAAGVVWALRERGYDVGGFDVLVDGRVPVGSGLSSSAALECAVLGAIDDLAGLGIDRPELTRIAQLAENDYAGAPTGIMDQSASLLCQAGHALLLDCRSLTTEQIPFDLDAVGLTLLVIDTRAAHSHVDSEYAARRRSCEQAAAALGIDALRDLTVADLDGPAVARLDETTRRRVRHVVTEDARVLQTVELLHAGRVGEIGPLLHASHESLRVDYEVTIPELDVAVEAAIGAGALGARMTGGGFGGCAIALAPLAAVGAVKAAVRRDYADRGFAEPGFLLAPPSAGAARL